MRALNVAVVGAGIGGLSAALALARAGHRVQLLERRTGFADLGAGLQLSPNASRILIGWGLGPALRRVASQPDRVAVRSIRSGKTIGAIALGAYMREVFGAPYWVARRADLQTALLDAVRSEPAVRLMVGRDVGSVEQHPGGVELRMLNAGRATETLSADLAIGADGVWSKLRAALGDRRAPRYRGTVAWRATIARPLVPAELAGNETGLWLGPSAHVVHYPIEQGRRLNIVAIERRTEPVDGWSTPGEASEILGRFAKAAPALRDFLALPSSWRLWSLYDLPARAMARGRLGLLGDAAHPVLPYLAQGAALAIEDADTLAACLSDGADVEAALARYETERLRRCRRVQDQARRNGRIYHADGLVAFGRDRALRYLGPEGLTRRYAWLYGHGAELQKRLHSDSSA